MAANCDPVRHDASKCLYRTKDKLGGGEIALGALPLALGVGAGAELRRPLGIVIVGGLLVSQVLTLYTTPVVYLWFDRAARAARKPRGVRPVQDAPHTVMNSRL